VNPPTTIVAAVSVLVILFVIAWDVAVLMSGATETISKVYCQWDVKSHWLLAGMTLAVWVHVFIGERLGK